MHFLKIIGVLIIITIAIINSALFYNISKLENEIENEIENKKDMDI